MRQIALRCFLLAAITVFPIVVLAQTATVHSAPVQRTVRHRTDPALYHPSVLTVKAPAAYEVRFVTTKGDFIVRVTRAWAPAGADRFYNLARHHFYNQASFFRVLPGFIVQFGLSANSAINKAWEKATIFDDPVTQSNLPGYVTFATAGPNTRTTQVFINLGNNTRLDSRGFAPFGQVTSGMGVVEKLYGGYGEGAPEGRGPSQDLITSRGKPYLDKNFPKLDSIVSTVIIFPGRAAHHHSATPRSSEGAGAFSSKP